MKSKWRVGTRTLDGEKVFVVYRFIGENGKRETLNEYCKYREDAVFLADSLNYREKTGSESTI